MRFAEIPSSRGQAEAGHAFATRCKEPFNQDAGFCEVQGRKDEMTL